MIMENAIIVCYNDTWKNVVRITNTVRSFLHETTFVAGLAALILVNLLASCDPNTPADTAEEVSVTTSAVDTEAPTELVTEAPTETTAEETTEEITEDRIVKNNDYDNDLYYGYDLVATLDQWPGLPNGEILPE